MSLSLREVFGMGIVSVFCAAALASDAGQYGNDLVLMGYKSLPKIVFQDARAFMAVPVSY
jgi:hypothetical protein